MISPYILPPHPLAQEAASEVIKQVHAYMDAHPESELHRQGKMFGVLVVERQKTLKAEGERPEYLAAFSAMLDGSYYHEGFVPPVTGEVMPVGHNREESRRLQRLLFSQYKFVNIHGEQKNLLDIFAEEKTIVPPDEWFGEAERGKSAGCKVYGVGLPGTGEKMPPSGAGECCAPKLLQYALSQGMQPIALAEFWVGAPSKTEIKREGMFYAPCSGRCVPILRWMLGEEESERGKGVGCRVYGVRLDILYEDEWLTVVNKPAGMLSVPGKQKVEISVEEVLSTQMSEVSGQPMFLRAVHRLDQDTSGLLVLAKTAEVYKTLQAYFQRRDIFKRYEAVVEGITGEVKGERGMIELPLLPNPYDRPRQMVDYAHGKPSLTRYHIRERRADGTVFVDFYPLTGRTHQLRIHAAHPEGLNAPIVGDRLYGVVKKGVGCNELTDERVSGLGGERLLLHAAEIRFVHPITQEEMHFCIPSAF